MDIFHQLTSIFLAADSTEKTNLIISVALIISSIFGTVVIPIIFNYFIIPKIEIRLEQKLKKWGIVIDIWLFGNFFMRYTVIASHVIIQYLILKIAKNPDMVIKKYNQKTAWATDLSKAGYSIRQASCFEILMSFIAVVNLIFWIVLVVIICFKYVWQI